VAIAHQHKIGHLVPYLEIQCMPPVPLKFSDQDISPVPWQIPS